MPRQGGRRPPESPPFEAPKRAQVVLQVDAEPELFGQITFQALPPDGIRVDAEFDGLEPGRLHGLHVRDGFDCNDAPADLPHFDGDQEHPDFKTETRRVHGNPNSIESHLGDLGNVAADTSGQARLTSVVRGELRVDEPHSPYDVLHRVVVLQQGEDDYASENPDNSGGVLACGTIELLLPE
jgi:superoxide dismutase, Cu-Zn family